MPLTPTSSNSISELLSLLLPIDFVELILDDLPLPIVLIGSGSFNTIGRNGSLLLCAYYEFLPPKDFGLP